MYPHGLISDSPASLGSSSRAEAPMSENRLEYCEQQPSLQKFENLAIRDNNVLEIGSRKSRQRERKAKDKINKKLLNAQKRKEKLEAQRSTAIAQINDLKGALATSSETQPLRLVAIDLEAWEQDTSKVTEIGIATFRYPSCGRILEVAPVHELSTAVKYYPVRRACESAAAAAAAPSRINGQIRDSADSSCFRHRHFIVREHAHLRNSRFVADTRDSYLFGDSEVVDLSEAVREVTFALGDADYIVGHAIDGDLAWLNEIGVEGVSVGSRLASFFVDTQLLHLASVITFESDGEENKQWNISLRNAADMYGLMPDSLHNGGNDAAFTLQVLLCQCGVSFEAPNRSQSQHAALPEYSKILAETEVRSLEIIDENARREEDLRREVESFASQIGHVKPDDSGRQQTHFAFAPADRSEKAFPPTLTSYERRVVHFVAEELGLWSLARGEGRERYVAISNVAYDSGRGGARQRRKAKNRIADPSPMPSGVLPG